jgi:predicted DsbA family dithiol-disulfide isomerase
MLLLCTQDNQQQLKYMVKRLLAASLIGLCAVTLAVAQQTKSMKKKTNNPLLCDTTTGLCELPDAGNTTTVKQQASKQKHVNIIYFTDPICSSCWGIEPQLRKLKLEYGTEININYRMGGLLPDWSYNSGGISKPSDVARHWDEVSEHYDMPIDGDVWLEDPLPSSYPPSIAFKAAQIQDGHKAILFLRRIREMVFLEKKNITRWEHLLKAAAEVGLDTITFEKDYNNGARDLFNEDLALARTYGVRGFPTLFFVNGENRPVVVYGTRPYSELEKALRQVYPGISPETYNRSWKSLFTTYHTLTTREYAELSSQPISAALEELRQLAVEGKIGFINSKKGPLWLAVRP